VLLSGVSIEMAVIDLFSCNLLGFSCLNSDLSFIDFSLSDLSVSVISPHGIRSQVLSCTVSLEEKKIEISVLEMMGIQK